MFGYYLDRLCYYTSLGGSSLAFAVLAILIAPIVIPLAVLGWILDRAGLSKR